MQSCTRGRLAQLGEHRVRNAGVGGSNPLPSTKVFNYLRSSLPAELSEPTLIVRVLSVFSLSELMARSPLRSCPLCRTRIPHRGCRPETYFR
jgi:hypothetical protein